MSNLNNEIDYSNLSDVLKFTFEQMLKGIYTAMPGIIESYDLTTKRARVRPAIQIQRTDGSFIDRPVIANCPVLQPSGGGFVVNFPIKSGDAVMCLFSQRGLSKFKQVYQNTQPDEALLDQKDAVIIPGFGALNISPATSAGVSMQTESGNNHVYVEDGHIRVTSTANVQVDCDTMVVNGNVCVNGNIAWSGNATDKAGTGPACFNNGAKFIGGNVTHNGQTIGDDHIHTGDSGGDTGVPK